MKTYLFETVTVNKTSDFYVCQDVVNTFKCKAASFSDAKKAYIKYAKKEVGISKTAENRAKNMYRDTDIGTQKVGFVLIGSIYVNFDGGVAKKRYVEMWVTVNELVCPFKN